MQIQTDIHEEDFAVTPLDQVEEVLGNNNWVFDRTNDDEIIVNVTGKGCDYRLYFDWQDDMNTIQFHCKFDINIPIDNIDEAARTLMNLNANLWMGHFDISADTCSPCYRYAKISASDRANTAEIESMIEIALAQCERAFPAFSMLSTEIAPDSDSLSLALMETCGES